MIEEAWPLRNNSWGNRNGQPTVKQMKGGGICFMMKINRRSNEHFIASYVGTSPSSFLKAKNESIVALGSIKSSYLLRATRS